MKAALKALYSEGMLRMAMTLAALLVDYEQLLAYAETHNAANEVASDESKESEGDDLTVGAVASAFQDQKARLLVHRWSWNGSHSSFLRTVVHGLSPSFC